ncbi:MAG TPA: DUF1326 domain-containing protein [Acidobacteriota bacterium]|nr:DUF1326 domain-containing protein [Acidobacteriota bacterium]
MFCRNIRKKLSAFIQGELEQHTASLVEAHLSECASCREEQTAIEDGIRIADRLPLVTAPEGLWQSVEEQMRKQRVQIEPVSKRSLIPRFALGIGIVAVIGLVLWFYTHSREKRLLKLTPATPQWSVNATVIEACSCPMFCQCYFNTKPAAHHEHGAGKVHYCRGNLAYKVNRGRYGSESLNGVKFWVASDVGSDFSKGETLWAVLYFDSSVNNKQREAVQTILSHLMPVKWKSFRTAEAKIDRWEFDNDSAYATLDAGKTAIIQLRRFQGITNEPVIIRNLRYWGAPRNDGFTLMPTEVQAYRIGPQAFEFKGTSGFLVTFDMNSEDLVQKKDEAKWNSPIGIQPLS